MPMRVRERYKAEPCALLDPKSGAHIVPDPTRQYADDDPVVLNAPWYFIAEGEQDEPAPDSVRIAEVEQATTAPGERRTTRRPKAK
ncbi:hypothetical protein [Nonomuraea typhae]|uniref:hypothetical protein n=1 Tax=Nonomuraea typhae TaxID=2603600 RepID=UPI0012F937B7|nr:hypothetical protein [Nonomuraea typhae]